MIIDLFQKILYDFIRIFKELCMINSITQNTAKYQSNQQGLARKRTLINALDTIDVQSGKYRVTADNAQRAYSAVPAMITMMPAVLLAPFMSDKKGLAKLAVPTFTLTALSALSYGIFSKKRGESSYKTMLAGQKEALENDLSNPKLFLDINEQRLKEINENPDYQNIINTNSSTDRSKLFLNFSFKDYKNFFKDIDEKTKKAEQTDPQYNSPLTKEIDIIDKRTQNYNNKIIAGMYLLYSGFCTTGACAGIALNSIANKYKKFSIPLKIGAFASALTPLFMIAGTSQKSFFSDIEQISRMKAKNDFLNNNYEDKNSINTYLDYKKTKDKYIQELEKQEHLTALRNDIIKNSDADRSEIIDAEAFQQEFKSAVNSKERAGRFRKTELNNSFASDFIFNVATSSILYPLLVAINRQFNAVHKSSTPLKIGIFASTAMSAGCLLNAGLAKLLHKKD